MLDRALRKPAEFGVEVGCAVRVLRGEKMASRNEREDGLDKGGWREGESFLMEEERLGVWQPSVDFDVVGKLASGRTTAAN